MQEFFWNNLHIIVPVVGTLAMPFTLMLIKGKSKMNNDVTDLLIQVRKKQAQISKQVTK